MPLFFSTWLFKPLLASSSHPFTLTRIVAVGPAQLSVAYLRKLFRKGGLWTQPTLFVRRELPRMVQPRQRLRCALATTPSTLHYKPLTTNPSTLHYKPLAFTTNPSTLYYKPLTTDTSTLPYKHLYV